MYELGPIPASLSVNQEFNAQFTVTESGVASASQDLHLRVIELDGRKVRLMDTDNWNGYTIIY